MDHYALADRVVTKRFLAQCTAQPRPLILRSDRLNPHVPTPTAATQSPDTPPSHCRASGIPGARDIGDAVTLGDVADRFGPDLRVEIGATVGDGLVRHEPKLPTSSAILGGQCFAARAKNSARGFHLNSVTSGLSVVEAAA